MSKRTKAFRLNDWLKGDFSAAARGRGREYFLADRVTGLELRPQGAWAQVHGSEVYQTGVRWWRGDGPDAVSLYCSCPAYDTLGPCKHVWALVQVLSKMGVGPPWEVKKPVELYLCDDDDVNADPEIAFGWPLGSDDEEEEEEEEEAAQDEEAEPRERLWHELAGWERSLQNFGSHGARWSDPWNGVQDRSWELRYVVDGERTEMFGALRLLVRVHKRLKNGNWNKGKEYLQGGYEMPPLDSQEDKLIHAKLQGANSGGFAGATGYGGYRVEGPLCREVLPEIARTGRLFLELGGDSELLAMDDGGAWDFRPSLLTDEAAGELEVRGEFLRGEEGLDVKDVQLFLEAGLFVAGFVLSEFQPWEAGEQISLLRQGELRAPLAAREQVMDVLMRTPGFQPEAGTTVVEGVVPSFHLYVRAAAPETYRAKDLDCIVSAVYSGRRVNIFQAGRFLAGEEGALTERDAAREAHALGHVIALGGTRMEAHGGGPDGCAVNQRKLSDLVMGLLAQNWEVEADGQVWRSAGTSSFSVKSGIDWFDLEGGMDFGGGQVASLPDLLAAAKAKTRVVKLGDGTMGVLPERWMESWGMLQLAGKVEGDALRFDKNQGWLLDALLAERGEVEVDAGFRKLRKRIAGFDGLKAKKEPKSFGGVLREYQRDGLGWFAYLRDLGINGCLADDMGLGKTIQVLALLEARRLNRKRKGGVDLPTLVVAPRSVVFNWIDEARKFAPKLKVLEYTGPGRAERLAQADAEGVDLIVTTYGTLRADVLDLAEREFDYVVLDEAQAIKNPRSLAARSARLLRARHKLALSGTPIENHLGELWSLFEFLNPGMLGASAAFQKFSKAGTENEAEDFSRLARALAPFFLRRTKEEVLKDLPEKTEQVLHCDLESAERKEYDKLRDFYRKSLTSREEEFGLQKMKIQVLEALLRLRQAACHPGLIDKERRGEDSAKLRVLMPMLEEICAEGHKALIFSQFTSLLSIVREKLDERGVVYEYLDGRTRKRKEKVDRFQEDDECPLFLISIKAGGSGLNLTKADYVFLLDPWWNPAVESQAIDRVHRIGRTKPVIAYRLIATGTVEQKVVELQENKRKLADAILGQGRVGLRDMTSEDLALLLS